MTAFRIGTPPPRVRARPNRDGTRLVCGRGDCGTTLVKVTLIGRGAFVYADAVRRAYGGRLEVGPARTEVISGYDWRGTGDDGVPRPTGHARLQFARDRRLAAGGGTGTPDHLTQEARGRLSSGRTLSHARPRDFNSQRSYEYGHWDEPGRPSRMECVACGAENDLPDELLVEAARNQRRHRITEEEIAQQVEELRADVARGRLVIEDGCPYLSPKWAASLRTATAEQLARFGATGLSPLDPD